MQIDGWICHLVFLHLGQQLCPSAPLAVRGRLGILIVRNLQDDALVFTGPLAGHHSGDFIWHDGSQGMRDKIGMCITVF